MNFTRILAPALVAIALSLGLSAPASSVVLVAAVVDHPGCVAAPALPGDDQVYWCDQYRVGLGADRVASCLLAMGFHGRPDDHEETIYASWQQIEWCASDPAGEWIYASSLPPGVVSV